MILLKVRSKLTDDKVFIVKKTKTKVPRISFEFWKTLIRLRRGITASLFVEFVDVLLS